MFGGVAGAVSHAMTGGRRDFSSEHSLRAAAYDVVVDSARADWAARILGLAVYSSSAEKPAEQAPGTTA